MFLGQGKNSERKPKLTTGIKLRSIASDVQEMAFLPLSRIQYCAKSEAEQESSFQCKLGKKVMILKVIENF